MSKDEKERASPAVNRWRRFTNRLNSKKNQLNQSVERQDELCVCRVENAVAFLFLFFSVLIFLLLLVFFRCRFWFIFHCLSKCLRWTHAKWQRNCRSWSICRAELNAKSQWKKKCNDDTVVSGGYFRHTAMILCVRVRALTWIKSTNFHEIPL